RLCTRRVQNHDPTRDDYLIAGHITAWIDGGTYDLDNERTECRKCSNSGGGDLAAQRNAEAKANAGADPAGSLRARGAREGRPSLVPTPEAARAVAPLHM